MSDEPEVSKTANFITRLEKLDAGDRARFRRNAGNTLAEAHNTLGLFYKVLPQGVPAYQEETYFLVATIYPLAESGSQKDFGSSLFSAKTLKNSKGLDSRVENLLDADFTQLHFRLRQTVKFLRSSRVTINWQKLLDDLLSWEHPDRFVQQRWARSYFGQ